jgi:hypothetical protein
MNTPKNPSYGAWRLTGIQVCGKHLYASYDRALMVQMSDGLWRPHTEIMTRELDGSMFAAKVPLADYEAMKAAFVALSGRLIELAKEHQKLPENEIPPDPPALKLRIGSPINQAPKPRIIKGSMGYNQGPVYVMRISPPTDCEPKSS